MNKIRIVLFVLIGFIIVYHYAHLSTLPFITDHISGAYHHVFQNKVIGPSLFITMIAVWSYFLICFFVTKTKSKHQVIVPVYKVPENLSPAECRYVLDGNVDQHAITGMILQLAAKNIVKIEMNKDKTYTVTRLTIHYGNLNETEISFAESLFAKSNAVILPLTDQNKILLTRGLSSSLDTQYRKTLFISQPWLEWPPMIAVALVLAALGFQDPFFFAFAAAYLPFCLIFKRIITGFILQQGSLLKKVVSLLAKWIGIALMLVFIFHQRNTGNIHLTNVIESLAISAIMMGNFFTNTFLLKLTPKAQQLKLQILGFRKFLQATEQQRLNFENPPKMTPELYDDYLPYAYALDLSQKWSAKFNKTVTERNIYNTWFGF